MNRTSDQVQEIFRKNLVKYRKECSFSQVELSRRCNYQKSYIGKIERGDAEPSLEALQRIARELEVKLLELLIPEKPSSFPMRGDILKSDMSAGELNEFYVGSERTDPKFCEQGPVGFLRLSPNGRILRINETFLKMLGYKSMTFVADDIGELLENQDWNEFRRHLDSAWEDESFHWFECNFLSATGEARPCLVCPNQSWQDTTTEETSLQRELFPSRNGEKVHENIEVVIVNFSPQQSSSVEK